jgi:hypothetical protein
MKKMAIGDIKPKEDDDSDSIHEDSSSDDDDNGDQPRCATSSPTRQDSPSYSQEPPLTSQDTQDQVEEPEKVQSQDDPTSTAFGRRTRTSKNHPIDLVLGDPKGGTRTRSKQYASFCKYNPFVSFVEPTTIDEALGDLDWILAMQDELNNFTRNQVWELAEHPKNKNVIGTKWVYRNKQDEHGITVNNKARLVAKGYSQVECLDYGETFAPMAHLEAICILLAYASGHKMKLFQMDVKSAFLNGFINEEVYVEQPPGFEDATYPHHAYRLHKALYGLKQSPRAWYERLRDFLIKAGFKIGRVDNTLFTR